MSAKPAEHCFFRRLGTQVTQTRRKLERENGLMWVNFPILCQSLPRKWKLSSALALILEAHMHLLRLHYKFWLWINRTTLREYEYHQPERDPSNYLEFAVYGSLEQMDPFFQQPTGLFDAMQPSRRGFYGYNLSIINFLRRNPELSTTMLAVKLPLYDSRISFAQWLYALLWACFGNTICS